jgi:hypothetical protein
VTVVMVLFFVEVAVIDYLSYGVTCTVQMIPPVRSLLSTSWDPEVRLALAKDKAEAAAKTTTQADLPATAAVGNGIDGTMMRANGGGVAECRSGGIA